MQLRRCLVVALALFGLLAMTAAADPLSLSGYTNDLTIAAGRVIFNGDTFNANLGDPMSLTGLQMGTFSLYDPTPGMLDPWDTVNKDFNITVTITKPPTDPGSQTLSANINAHLDPGTPETGSAIMIHFDPTPAVFKFADGEFYLTMRDIGVGYLGNVPLMGDISLNSVPEPASLFLVGSALLGIGVVCRRRKQA